jgi:hypothetical protein
MQVCWPVALRGVRAPSAEGAGNDIAALVFQYMLLPNVVVILFSFNAPKGRFNFIWEGFTFKNWIHWNSVLGISGAVQTSLEVAALATVLVIAGSVAASGGGQVAGKSTAAPAENGRIAFRAINGTGFDIWTMNPDGTQLRKLTAGPLYDAQADWSPDGRRLAFVVVCDDGRFFAASANIVNADGSGLRDGAAGFFAVRQNGADDSLRAKP